MDVSFIVAVSIFILFISLILVSAINYFTRTPESASIIELREKTKSLFDTFFGSGGISTNERVTTDLYRVPILLEENNGTDRTNAIVSLDIEFDLYCDKITGWNDTVRVYGQSFDEMLSRISYQEFCRSQLLNTSTVTFFTNISANGKKRIYVYWINNSDTQPPRHNITIRGYWKFDDGSGTLAKDWSGWQNNGTLYNSTDICANQNCPTWVTGIYGNAAQLDGVDDYVNVSDSTSLNVTGGNVTLAAWVNLNGTSGGASTGRIISKTAGSGSEQYELLYTTDSHDLPNRFRLDVRTSDGLVSLYTNETFASTSRWYHVAGVYNFSHMAVYVDGLEKNTSTQTGTVTGRASGVSIGRASTGDSYFNGTIDDVRIYNTSLTASQASELALRSNQPLVVTAFPSQTITAIDASKVQNLTSRDYQEIKALLGGDFDFRIEIREKQ